MENYREYEYISLNRNKNVSIRGHPPVQLIPYNFSKKGILNSICIPIHSMTHISLPEIIHISKFKNYLSPQIFENALIIDCTDKQSIIKNFLMKTEKDDLFEDFFEYPLIDIEKIQNTSSSDNALLKIIKDLNIDTNYLERKFSEKKNISHDFNLNISDAKVLILRTDWMKFRYNTDPINSIHAELFHAFLLHPYITLNTIRDILKNNHNLVAIATDSPSLDNPIKFVNYLNAMPIVQKTWIKALEMGIFQPDEKFITDYFSDGYQFSLNISTSDEIIEKINDKVIFDEFASEGHLLMNPKLTDIKKTKQSLDNELWRISDGDLNYSIKKDKKKIRVYLKDTLRYIILNLARLNYVQKDNEIITNGKIQIIPVRPLSDPTGIVIECYYNRDEKQ